MTGGLAYLLGSLSLCWPGETVFVAEDLSTAVLQDRCTSPYERSLLQSSRVLKAATTRENLQVPRTSSVQVKGDASTLFYHIHIPRTGGTTVANLITADICTPLEDNVTVRGVLDDGVSTEDCVGLTDNLFSGFPKRMEFEHNTFAVNAKRAERLLVATGAQKTVFVTTLRRGSDRVLSQWALEILAGKWSPPVGIANMSNESLQLYITGASFTPHQWIRDNRTGSLSQRNNLQVAQLASIGPEWRGQRGYIGLDDRIITREHVEAAKHVLMTGDWLIGFTDCMNKVHGRLTSYADSLIGPSVHKEYPRASADIYSTARPGHRPDALWVPSKVVLSQETSAMLDAHCSLDNELFDWAWARAGTDARFAGTC